MCVFNRKERMTSLEVEIRQGLDKVGSGTPFVSSASVSQYIQYADNHGFEARYFSTLNSGLILYVNKIIMLIEENGHAVLRINGDWLS